MSKKYLRQRRLFSVTLRKEVVRLVESGKLSVSAASREYHVTRTSIYNWIYKYSTYNEKGVLLVADKKSQTEKVNQLQQQIAELERALGHKQMQVDFYEKFVEFASEEVGTDLKKKYESVVTSGSLTTKKTSAGR